MEVGSRPEPEVHRQLYSLYFALICLCPLLLEVSLIKINA